MASLFWIPDTLHKECRLGGGVVPHTTFITIDDVGRRDALDLLLQVGKVGPDIIRADGCPAPPDVCCLADDDPALVSF
jgi:hypothetical protein